ncbi:glucan biosynthesis protein D [Terrarubrum flagellatum]|uniref:glucan biosynthesis protein n=1 Tax=Terrirubrum flagellatum TaxID=2895980 RepID=UPI00314563AE
MIDRRTLLGATALMTLPAAVEAQPDAKLAFGPGQAFSFEALQAHARDLAKKPYEAPPALAADILRKIDYETHGKIRYKPSMALFAKGPGRYPVTFFHLGQYFQKPVRMHQVEGGQARELLYSADLFDMPADSIARKLPANAGFAGFRFQESRDNATIGREGKPLDWAKNDWVAFLGASYFRAIGELFQYGLSARGVAIDPAIGGAAEEFPDFTHVYIETPKDDGAEAVVYALLNGPSLAGAYKFIMTRGKGVVMDIEKHLFLRKPVARFGLAPLTSMFWYSETVKSTAVDWRPEVHDSDGLALWTGAGERIWRPLNNPPRTMASSFADVNPRGFGLLQRDRAVDHYLDGVAYERRPSLWVEPIGDWGRGAVQLIEIPTDDEIHDNIVALWQPAEPTQAGSSAHLHYRLHWLADEPYPTPLARCVATRLGNGGQPGLPRPKGVRKFMVEFKGGPLEHIPFGVKPEAVLWASRGTFSYVFTEAVPNDVPGHWRAQFDLTVDGHEPVEMRLFLRTGAEVLTESWLYQYHPF